MPTEDTNPIVMLLRRSEREAAALLALGVAFDKAVERFGAERLAAALVCDPVHS